MGILKPLLNDSDVEALEKDLIKTVKQSIDLWHEVQQDAVRTIVKRHLDPRDIAERHSDLEEYWWSRPEDKPIDVYSSSSPEQRRTRQRGNHPSRKRTLSGVTSYRSGTAAKTPLRQAAAKVGKQRHSHGRADSLVLPSPEMQRRI